MEVLLVEWEWFPRIQVILPFFMYSVMDSRKVMAVIAKFMRKSGFKGKIEPHLDIDNVQITVSSVVYSDIVYSVRMEGVKPKMYVYRLVDEVWKPVRPSGIISNYFDVLHYEERKDYKNYYEYFSYYKYDKFGPEYSLLSSCIEKVTNTIIQKENQ